MAGATLLSKVFMARSVLLEQLEERGLDVSDYSGASVAEVKAMLEARQLDILEEGADQKVYVKFHIDKTLRPKALYEIVEDLFELENVLSDGDDLIVVSMDSPNATMSKVVDTLWSQSGHFITLLGIEQLQYNVLRHRLVPPHQKLLGEELEKFKSRYRTEGKAQLPEIDRSDPVARAIGLRPGEICKITRPSRTAVKAPFYRICSI